MKRLLFFIMLFITVFLIYFFNIDKKIYFVSIGDYLTHGTNNNISFSENIRRQYNHRIDRYVKYSSIKDYRVMDLINDVNNNKEINYEGKQYTIQHLLIKADQLTISIGMNDLIYKKNASGEQIYSYIDELLKDIDSLLLLVRKYNKEQIYFLGFYNVIDNNQVIEYANKRLKVICDKNNINFVDISFLKDYIEKGIYPNKEGIIYISKRIINFTKR